MEKLAMEDALTGIKNRNAFTGCEKKLLEKDSGSCVFVHFDVNRLKKVNDTYGHAEGDKHIKAAANVLKNSFGEYGECFRIGGDEFFVILEGRKCREEYENGLKKFLNLQEDYNNSEKPPVPLEMAYGMAEYDCSMKNPEAAESLADSRMYEKKKLMKANSLKKNINGNFGDIKPPEFIRTIKKAE
ncbi:MAG: GGDEF domain-containing protein [Ruminococcus sp.]|nr:GGDEF domain-containing protein [Ruminococcus sp.]